MANRPAQTLRTLRERERESEREREEREREREREREIECQLYNPNDLHWLPYRETNTVTVTRFKVCADSLETPPKLAARGTDQNLTKIFLKDPSPLIYVSRNRKQSHEDCNRSNDIGKDE